MSDDAVDVGAANDFKEGKGCEVDVKGRAVSVFRHKGNLYALDHHCYHFGGPLANGDIEEFVLPSADSKAGGRWGDGAGTVHPCVICPSHKYKISLKTGEGIEAKGDCAKSKGRKQRTHLVYEDGNGRVMAKLNMEGELDSDGFA